MNLAKMFEAQRILVARIEKEHPRAEGEDRLPKLILALQVELGELANEWRGFKFWSKYQKPSKNLHTTQGATTHNAAFYRCSDDHCQEQFDKNDNRLNDLFGKNDEDCPVCEQGLLYAFRNKNPLLEEYVDCLHFILSIGLELNIQEHYAEEVNFNIGSRAKKTFPTDEFRNTFRKIAVFDMHWNEQDSMDVFNAFATLGDSLGFSEGEVEEAYFRKNAINHERQATGY